MERKLENKGMMSESAWMSAPQTPGSILQTEYLDTNALKMESNPELQSYTIKNMLSSS